MCVDTQKSMRVERAVRTVVCSCLSVANFLFPVFLEHHPNCCLLLTGRIWHLRYPLPRDRFVLEAAPGCCILATRNCYVLLRLLTILCVCTEDFEESSKDTTFTGSFSQQELTRLLTEESSTDEESLKLIFEEYRLVWWLSTTKYCIYWVCSMAMCIPKCNLNDSEALICS
jgi:hypothetical protein